MLLRSVVIAIAKRITFNISFMYRRTIFEYTYVVRLFKNRAPIIKVLITRINGSFVDCYCDINRVELLLYVVEIVFNCNKEVIEDLMVSIS